MQEFLSGHKPDCTLRNGSLPMVLGHEEVRVLWPLPPTTEPSWQPLSLQVRISCYFGIGIHTLLIQSTYIEHLPWNTWGKKKTLGACPWQLTTQGWSKSWDPKAKEDKDINSSILEGSKGGTTSPKEFLKLTLLVMQRKIRNTYCWNQRKHKTHCAEWTQ
jgi:hypothetical protein